MGILNLNKTNEKLTLMYLSYHSQGHRVTEWQN